MTNTIILYNSKRPKIWLRRCNDDKIKCAIRSYILNRNTQAEQWSIENLEALYAGQPIAIGEI